MSTTEQRRYPRVRISPVIQEINRVLGARVEWPNREVTDILDLSYKGMAARRPGLLPFQVQERMDIDVELGGCPPFRVRARVAWCNAQNIGLEVSEFPANGHLALAAYLDAKLIGMGLRVVPRTFVSRDQSFQFWFQGPANTNVFVWSGEDSRIERVSVNLDGEVVEFFWGQRLLTPSALEQRALLVLSEMDNRTTPMEEFVRSMGHLGD